MLLNASQNERYELSVQGLPVLDSILGLSMLLCPKARDSCLSVGEKSPEILHLTDGSHVLLVQISAIAQDGGDTISSCCLGSADDALNSLSYVCILPISREPTKEAQVLGSNAHLKQDLLLCRVALLLPSSRASSWNIRFQYQVGRHALRVC